MQQYSKMTQFLFSSLSAICLTGVVAANSAFAAPQENEMEMVEAYFQERVELRIEDINRTCELNESQIKKFEIAGNGAIASAMEMEKEGRETLMGLYWRKWCLH